MLCILVVGVPGCGKTSIIDKYAKENKNVEVINFGRLTKHSIDSDKLKTGKQLVSQIKNKNADKVIIEGFPLTVVQASKFTSTLYKYFRGTLVLDMMYTPNDHKNTYIKSDKKLQGRMIQYSTQTKLGLTIMEQKSDEKELPIIVRRITLKPKEFKNNYDKFKRSLTEFDALVAKADKSIEEEQEQLELDFNKPEQIVNFLIALYNDNNLPEGKELLQYLLAYKNRQNGK